RSHHNLGILHYGCLRLEESLACQRKALALDPDFAAARSELAQVHLLRGDFQAGWRDYDCLYRMPGTPKLLPQNVLDGNPPVWDGAPAATLLLLTDQGFGDAIQFARFIPWVAERCGKVVLGSGPELKALLSPVPGIGAIFSEWKDMPAFDAYC